MKAAVLCGEKKMEIRDLPDPKPGPGEVLIRVKAVGVCGSDVHYYWSGGIGIHKVEYPMLLGHEAAGEVVDVGEGVTKFKPGRRVSVEPGKSCGRCERCRQGKYNLCDDMQFMGTPPIDGCFCEYVAWPQEFVFPLPDNVSYEEAALLEPLAVGVYATDMADLRVGDSAAVLGSATVGLLTLQCAKEAGAMPCFVTDRIPERLALAERMGADRVINFAEEDVAETIKKGTGGEGVDVVFEAAGHPSSFFQTVDLARKGGEIVLIGICQKDVIEFDFGNARRKELTIKSVRRYRHAFPRAIKLLESGAVDVKPLITHKFGLEGIVEAFHISHDCRDGVIKAVILP